MGVDQTRRHQPAGNAQQVGVVGIEVAAHRLDPTLSRSRMSAPCQLGRGVVHGQDRRGALQDHRPHGAPMLLLPPEPPAPRRAASAFAAASTRPPIMRRPAAPVGDQAARRLDHRNRRRHVIGLQPRLDHQIDAAGGDQRIAVAIHAIAGQPHPGCQRAEGGAFGGVPTSGKVVISRASARLRRLLDTSARLAQRPAQQRPAEATLEALADIGLVDDAVERPAGVRDRDQHAPGRRAGQIAAGAVDRVEHPGQAGCARPPVPAPRQGCRLPV